MKRGRLPKLPKVVAYTLITREENPPIYERLDRIVSEFHDEILMARIALAWCTSWKPDVDGRRTLGKCKKASDLDRELAAFDFVILLNRGFWVEQDVTEQQRDALLDHELCHAAPKLDKDTLEHEEDSRGRKLYRIRRHDLEEFAEIAARYGTWKRDLELFAKALERGRRETRPLLVEAEDQTTIEVRR